MRGRHSQLDQCQSAAGPNSGSGRDRCLQVGNEPGDVVRRHHRGVKVDRDLLAVTVDNQLHGEHDDQRFLVRSHNKAISRGPVLTGLINEYEQKAHPPIYN